MTTKNNELCFLTIGEASNLIRDKKLSPVDLTQAYLDRIEAIDGKVKSYVTSLPESALQEARVAETDIHNQNYRGPLHGVPIGLKDLYDTYVEELKLGADVAVNSDVLDSLNMAPALRSSNPLIQSRDALSPAEPSGPGTPRLEIKGGKRVPGGE